MAYTLWSQDIFSKGELSPFMYARCTVNEYNNGLKTAQNVLTYPVGAAGKRFGTLFQTQNSHIPDAKSFYFQTFQYLNECVYQILFTPGFVDIYLEGILQTTLSNTLSAFQIYNMISTTIGTNFRVTGTGFKPSDIVRAANSPSAITGFTFNTFTCTGTPFVVGKIYPAKFSVTGGTIMQTVPPLTAGVTYFIGVVSTTTAIIFDTPQKAKYFQQTGDGSFAFTITGLGTGTTSCIPLNTWSFVFVGFKNLPVYDFNGPVTSYDAITFTPGVVTGTTTITLSAPYAPLTTAYIGGAFIGGGGSSRIINVIDTSTIHVAIQKPFDSVDPIQGSLALLAEPAWSDARGWPQVCSSYQSRALFANTVSLPNGFYASVINDYTDFGDLTTDDDDAISWYPTSDNMNYIKFIVPYRSITVHTNTGIYSSPLSDVVAITPTNFTLQLQDSTPADVLQPVAIDNQVLVLSGNDAHQMLWDGINNAYTSGIVSIISEQTIRNPVDETAFVDLRRAGSRFVFIINESGSMAVFQTLISQNVAGFTPQIMEQSYGEAYFRQAASSADGRCWFIAERQILQGGGPVAITGFTGNSLHAVGTNFNTERPTATGFSTTGTFPTCSTPLNSTTYYWSVGIDADNFKVYASQEDAIADENAFTFSDAGISASVYVDDLVTIFTLEELSKDVFLDCAVYYKGNPTSTVNTGALFNAQDVKMVGNGYGFSAQGINNQVEFIAHGSDVNVTEAYIGFPIHTIMEPMPLSISSGPSSKQSVLTKPINVNFARFMFNNTIGGTINGVPIALKQFDEVPIGEPPVPQRGIVELSIFSGWDDFNNPVFTIEHSEPFDIQLLGVFYSVETS